MIELIDFTKGSDILLFMSALFTLINTILIIDLKSDVQQSNVYTSYIEDLYNRVEKALTRNNND